jgi:macrodomain Ter protein organizer (MatP/YcbG family)
MIIKMVKLKEKTHKRLNTIPVKMGTTYDDIINMLIDEYENNNKR